MSSYISKELRQAVSNRARRRCEYCLIDERCTTKAHEVDHICAEKHGGDTVFDNLCLSCFDCNRHKGSDLCSLDTNTGQIVALFHPRLHSWSEHFGLTGGQIEPLTAIGRVTIRLLGMNAEERLEERTQFLQARKYPDYLE